MKHTKWIITGIVIFDLFMYVFIFSVGQFAYNVNRDRKRCDRAFDEAIEMYELACSQYDFLNKVNNMIVVDCYQTEDDLMEVHDVLKKAYCKFSDYDAWRNYIHYKFRPNHHEKEAKEMQLQLYRYQKNIDASLGAGYHDTDISMN